MKKFGLFVWVLLFVSSLSVSAWPWSKKADAEPVKEEVVATKKAVACTAEQKAACKDGEKVDCTTEQKAACKGKKKASCQGKKAACEKKKSEKKSACSKKKFKCGEKSNAPASEDAVSEVASE